MFVLTLWECSITLLSKAHGAVREPERPFREQDQLSVQTKFSSHGITNLQTQNSKFTFQDIRLVRWRPNSANSQTFCIKTLKATLK